MCVARSLPHVGVLQHATTAGMPKLLGGNRGFVQNLQFSICSLHMLCMRGSHECCVINDVHEQHSLLSTVK